MTQYEMDLTSDPHLEDFPTRQYGEFLGKIVDETKMAFEILIYEGSLRDGHKVWIPKSTMRPRPDEPGGRIYQVGYSGDIKIDMFMCLKPDKGLVQP